MSDWTYPLLILPGLLIGMLVWSRIGHLLQIFTKVDAGSEAAKECSGSSLRMQIIGGVAFVVCWLGLFGGLAYYVLFERNGSIGWFWFLAGIAATPCIILPSALYFLRRGSNGIFLFGGGALAWLPDSALTDARPNDVAQFIGERMPLLDEANVIMRQLRIDRLHGFG